MGATPVPSRRWAAALVLAGTTLVSFQGGLLRVAYPVIRAELDATIAAMQAVSLAGLVVTTATVVAFGRLGDMIGPRRIYAAGLSLFALGAALSAAAPSPGLLIAAQAGQGLGWSMALSSGTPLLVRAFPAAERGRVVAASHMSIAVGLATGPALGGLVVERLGWRVALGALVPAAAGLATLVWARLPPDAPGGERRRFDLAGSALLALALASVLLALDSRGRQGAGPPGAPMLGALALVAFVAFLVHERRVTEPMVDLRLFTDRAFSAGLAASFLTFAAMGSNMFLLPFFLQEVLGQSVSRAGATMMVVPLGILVAAPIAGWASDRTQPRLPATAGMVLTTAAIVSMAGFSARVPWMWLVAVLAVYGVGAGFFQSPNISGVLSAAPPERLGVASGTLATVGRLGQVVGVAVAGGIWQLGVRDDPSPAASLAAFHRAFLALAAFGALAALASWLRGPVRDHRTAPPAQLPAA